MKFILSLQMWNEKRHGIHFIEKFEFHLEATWYSFEEHKTFDSFCRVWNVGIWSEIATNNCHKNDTKKNMFEITHEQ